MVTEASKARSPMAAMPFRPLTIIAKDPGLRIGGKNGPMAFAQVDVAAEKLAKGPIGYRIKVVDYNATDRVTYQDMQEYEDAKGQPVDPFAPRPGESFEDSKYQARLIGDPNFHAQNAYAIAMRTLWQFEHALGRRVRWSFGGHQLHIAPHAFAQANAFYSEPDRTLMFGYFRNAKGEAIYTSLSHDIVAHETTHALLDGLRTHFTEPSLPDQAALHEGFADIVALFSVFSIKQVVAAAIGEDGTYAKEDGRVALVKASKLSLEALQKSVFMGIGAQFGRALNDASELRRSVLRTPKDFIPDTGDEHDRGELIVAILTQTFVTLWHKRIGALGKFGRKYNLGMVVDEGAKLAQQLLTMCIRGLDYCPPTDIDFGQFLAGVLTCDREVAPDDSQFNYREVLRDTAAGYGVHPPADQCDDEGCWKQFAPKEPLSYMRSNFAAMTQSKDELFRFLWENRDEFHISTRAFSKVLSIDAAHRTGPDGINLCETICQYSQRVDLYGAETKSVLGFDRPTDMSSKTAYTSFGGGVLILDQYGQVKYHICNPLDGGQRQFDRLVHLSDTGELDGRKRIGAMRFALCHMDRMGA